MDARLKRMVVDPRVLRGKPVIEGARIPVCLVVDFMASGMNEAEILREYPRLGRGDIRAALQYASNVLRQEEVIPIEA